jgi:uncharacterized membrane protein
MTRGRLEAFSDAVIAILMTIMVLELRPPPGASLGALIPLVPRLIAYALSFVFLGIYWSNHHHLFQAVQRINGAVLWANLFLLFWLSLVPFATAWLSEVGLQSLPVAVYGGVLFLSAVAYFILVRTLLALHGAGSPLAVAVGRDAKARVSILIYALAIALAFLSPALAWGLYVVVAVIWVVPDRRIERTLVP